MSKESSAAMASLAARLMNDPVSAKPAEIVSLAASVLAQREPDPGNRVTLMHRALVALRSRLSDKTTTPLRADLLSLVSSGLGE